MSDQVRLGERRLGPAQPHACIAVTTTTTTTTTGESGRTDGRQHRTPATLRGTLTLSVHRRAPPSVRSTHPLIPGIAYIVCMDIAGIPYLQDLTYC